MYMYVYICTLQASQIYPHNGYLQELCFNGVFSLFLLQTGFGFDSPNTNWTLIFMNKVYTYTCPISHTPFFCHTHSV